MGVPRFKEIRRSYGFDEVAIVPGEVTINPEQVDMSLTIGEHHFSVPVLASAMDAVVSPDFAVKMGKLGGLAVLNLEGLWTRYPDAADKLAEVAETPDRRGDRPAAEALPDTRTGRARGAASPGDQGRRR